MFFNVAVIASLYYLTYTISFIHTIVIYTRNFFRFIYDLFKISEDPRNSKKKLGFSTHTLEIHFIINNKKKTYNFDYNKSGHTIKYLCR